MTIQKRKSSWAIMCDCPHCHMELIRHTKDMVIAEAKEENWKIDGGNHKCFDCENGNCPGEAVAEIRFGQSSHGVITDIDVKAGDPVYYNKNFVGYAKSDAKSGDPVQASLVAKPDERNVYSTEDENGEPKPASFSQAHGNTIPGVTSVASRDSLANKAKEISTPKRKGPKVDQKGLSEIEDLFQDFYTLIGDSGGKPDKLN